MKTTGLFLLIGSIGISTLAGCGGNVTVEPSGGNGGEGGAGGDGGSTSSTSSTASTVSTGTTTPTGTTSTSGTSTTTTTTDPQTYCAYVCSQANQYMCLDGPVSECAQGCSSLFDDYPECSADLVALYDCAVQALPAGGCEVEQECQNEALAFSECVNGGTVSCGELGCSEGPGSCSCEGECYGDYLVTDCKDQPNGYACTCSVNGVTAGTCQGPGGACGIFESCCSEYFFPEDG